ncbi:MAG: NAD(P)/FAD-dependent oxidoreductase [Actinobacteria bacterium]|nr:NAD(P)/FAD-dependent oxidoreductase [Actinomycetota bacterium]MCB8997774.1 NAD(P)/FAD-dependent oxidoreductase [Actinomycetota bacterium]MCB9424076.1 NAD(P)/FAD-dependent oxidoreductase [Actinomycetota bacterium]HRY09055.1 NAD(P)/FAD-dependent oxidoreductase [Candidatus Nanopelagicales bacterium]
MDTDVIVIGAGPGGLACAAYLSAVGRKVVLVDRHTVPGGNMSCFTHRDPATGEEYEFDVGLHYLGDCGPRGSIPSVLAPLGVRPDYLPMDASAYDTLLFGDGQEFGVPAGLNNYEAALIAAFPAERAAIEQYVGLLKDVRSMMRAGMRRPGLAQLPGLAMPAYRMLRLMNATLGDVLDRIGASPRLRAVLAGINGTYGLPPSRASFFVHAGVFLHYANGAWYPQGGGQPIADALARVVRDNGGEVLLRTQVEEILVTDGEVRGVRVRRPAADRRRGLGDEISAPVVVSDADLKRTFLELLPPESLPADLRRKAARMGMSAPLYIDYLILDRDLVAEGKPNTNWWVYPDDDVDAAYSDAAAGRMTGTSFAYLTSASLKDPTNPRLARPGQTNIQVMTVAPADHGFWGLHGPGPVGGESYRRNPEYLRRKAEMHESLMRAAERAIPGISDAVVFHESATPITHERFVRSTGGTSYGLAATPSQMLHKRPGAKTPITGLWMVGADTRFLHGIGGTLGGGMMTAAAISGEPVSTLARLKLPDVWRPEPEFHLPQRTA